MNKFDGLFWIDFAKGEHEHLIHEYIRHTDANSQFCEYVSKLKSTYL